jgi:hypothetical protein
MIGKASTRSLLPTPALESARGRFTVVGMTGVFVIAGIAVIARHRRDRKSENQTPTTETQRHGESQCFI